MFQQCTAIKEDAMASNGKLVDAHEHLGDCRVFGLNTNEDDLLRRMEDCEIDAMIVQPYPGATNAMKTHDRIANLCAKHPGRFFGLASLNPHQDRDAYRKEIE